MERIGKYMVSHPFLATIPLVGLSALAVFVGAYNFFEIRNQGERVTKIERTPCQANSSGPECAADRRSVARLEPLSNICISLRRAIRPRTVFRRFTRCGDFRREHDLPTDVDRNKEESK